MTTRRAWQMVEGRIAARFGAKRSVCSGSMGRDDLSESDSTHPNLFIECKMREKHSAVSLYDDTAKKAKKEKKTPVVALAEKGRPGFWILVHVDHLRSVADELVEPKGDF
jgi:hypothetical protein